MDIITHTLSGIALSSIVASFSKKEAGEKGAILICGAIGGASPDIDAITLWSGFDGTIGKVLHLSRHGRDIYSGNLWYSHHFFTHSIAGGIAFAILFAIIAYIFFMAVYGTGNARYFLKHYLAYPLAFLIGHFAHLLGDIPTPGAAWGGIGLFWPFGGNVGGTGQTWWWNNYDIFLIVLACCLANLTALCALHFAIPGWKQYLPAVFCLIAFSAALYQIEHRGFDFAYDGRLKPGKHLEYEKESLTIQKKILGKKLFSIMRDIDASTRIPF